jgi:hypothetical protein
MTDKIFFHLKDGHFSPDETGATFNTMADAKDAALQHMTDMLRGQPGNLWETGELVLMATDEAGLLLFTLHMLATSAPVLGLKNAPG